MTRPSEKADLKIGERYISCMIAWVLLEIFMRATAGRLGNPEERIAANLVEWIGMPSGLAEIVAIFILGTLLFPFVLFFEVFFHSRTPRYEVSSGEVKRPINRVAYGLGRIIARVLSKLNRS